MNRLGEDTVVEMEFYRVNQNEFGQEYLATVEDATDEDYKPGNTSPGSPGAQTDSSVSSD